MSALVLATLLSSSALASAHDDRAETDLRVRATLGAETGAGVQQLALGVDLLVRHRWLGIGAAYRGGSERSAGGATLGLSIPLGRRAYLDVLGIVGGTRYFDTITSPMIGGRAGAAARFGAFILGGALLVEHDTRATTGTEVPHDCGLLGCLNLFGVPASTTERRTVRGTMVTLQFQIGLAFDA